MAISLPMLEKAEKARNSKPNYFSNLAKGASNLWNNSVGRTWNNTISSVGNAYQSASKWADENLFSPTYVADRDAKKAVSEFKTSFLEQYGSVVNDPSQFDRGLAEYVKTGTVRRGKNETTLERKLRDDLEIAYRNIVTNYNAQFDDISSRLEQRRSNGYVAKAWKNLGRQAGVATSAAALLATLGCSVIKEAPTYRMPSQRPSVILIQPQRNTLVDYLSGIIGNTVQNTTRGAKNTYDNLLAAVKMYAAANQPEAAEAESPQLAYSSNPTEFSDSKDEDGNTRITNVSKQGKPATEKELYDEMVRKLKSTKLDWTGVTDSMDVKHYTINGSAILDINGRYFLEVSGEDLRTMYMKDNLVLVGGKKLNSPEFLVENPPKSSFRDLRTGKYEKPFLPSSN